MEYPNAPNLHNYTLSTILLTKRFPFTTYLLNNNTTVTIIIPLSDRLVKSSGSVNGHKQRSHCLVTKFPLRVPVGTRRNDNSSGR